MRKPIIQHSLADAFEEEIISVVNWAISEGFQPRGDLYRIADRLFQPLVKTLPAPRGEERIIEYSMADAFYDEIAEVMNRATAAGFTPFGNPLVWGDRIYQPLAKYDVKEAKNQRGAR